MSLRAHLRMLYLAPLAGVVVGLMFLMPPAPASAAPDITISLTNAPSYCVNRKGGNNSAGATVYLWACSGGNNHWYEANAFNASADPACADNQCIVFEDYWNTRECFGLGSNDTGTLGSCNNILQFWVYQSGHILRNAYWGQDLVTGNDADGSTLSGYPSPIDWHQWTGP